MLFVFSHSMYYGKFRLSMSLALKCVDYMVNRLDFLVVEKSHNFIDQLIMKMLITVSIIQEPI